MRDHRTSIDAGPRALPENPSLTEISNAVVALHREHFGRGPGAAKSYLADDLIICVMSEVFTPMEQILIDAGEGERVRETRAIHLAATQEVYRERMSQTVGLPVRAHLGTVDIDADLAVDIFALDRGRPSPDIALAGQVDPETRPGGAPAGPPPIRVPGAPSPTSALGNLNGTK